MAVSQPLRTCHAAHVQVYMSHDLEYDVSPALPLVTTTGVDMTPAQLDVANRNMESYTKDTCKFSKPNMKFIHVGTGKCMYTVATHELAGTRRHMFTNHVGWEGIWLPVSAHARWRV
jgi:hypothetical protein